MVLRYLVVLKKALAGFFLVYLVKLSEFQESWTM